MLTHLHTSQGQQILVDEQALGEGGEGKIYRVTAPAQWLGYVAKIFHPSERTKDKHLKINYLKQNHPPINDDFSVIWVKELLFENQSFVGYLMHEVPNGINLTYLCNLTLSEKLPIVWHKKYGRQDLTGLLNRLKICYNLAAAIAQIHQSQRYVVIDLKPENIQIRPNGQVSILDLDSLQVIDNQILVFPARKLTPEYSPPEIKKIQIKSDLIPESWDRFSLGVIFYKILFGLHPFSVTGRGQWEELSSHEQKIQAGLFAHGTSRQELAVVPLPHQNFKALSADLQMFFQRALDDNPQSRPTAEDWLTVLAIPKIKKEYYQDPQKLLSLSTKVANVKPTKPQHADSQTIKQLSILVQVILIIFILSIYLNRDWRIVQTTQNNDKIKTQGVCGTTTLRATKLVDGKYDDIQQLFSNFFSIKFKEKYGVIKIDKGIIITPQYDSIYPLAERFFVVKANNKFGVLDTNANLLINNDFEKISAYSEGLFLARQAGKYGFLNHRGKVIIPFIYDEALPFHNGAAWVKYHKYEFAIDQNKQIVATRGDAKSIFDLIKESRVVQLKQ